MANQVKLDLKDKDRFTGQNYDVWAHRIRTILQIEDTWEIVDGTTTKPAAPAAAQADITAWKKKDLRARAILELSIDSSMIHHIDDAVTSHQAWTSLSQMFATTNQSSLVHATRSFWNCKMKDHDSVEDLMCFRHLRQKLASAGTKVTEIQASMALLMSLPEKYRVFVSSHNNALRSATAGAVTLSSTIGALLEEEASMASNKHSSGSSSRVLFSSSRGGRGGRGGRGNYQRYQNRGRGFMNSPNSGSSSRKVPCPWCRIPGHSEQDCRKKKAGEPRRPAPQEANLSTKSKATTILAIYLAHTRGDKGRWYLDSGASTSICRSRKNFINYRSLDPGNYVLLGDESGLLIAGSGDVPLKLSNGSIKVLKQVLHVPQMTKNLVSVRQICKDWEVTTDFHDQICYVKNKYSAEVVMRAHL